MSISEDTAALVAAQLTHTLVTGRRMARGDTRVAPPKPDSIARLYREFFELVRQGDAYDIEAWLASQRDE